MGDFCGSGDVLRRGERSEPVRKVEPNVCALCPRRTARHSAAALPSVARRQAACDFAASLLHNKTKYATIIKKLLKGNDHDHRKEL